VARVYFYKSKDAKEVHRVFQAFRAFVEKEANASILHFGCDNGKGGYDSQLFENFLSANCISFEPSAPYTKTRTVLAREQSALLLKGDACCYISFSTRKFENNPVGRGIAALNKRSKLNIQRLTPL
jgi:hypothetical protein